MTEGRPVLGRRPGGRQPAARLGRAEQDVGERVARLLAREPAQQHRGHLVEPRHQHGRAGVDDDDRPRLRLVDAADELVLAAGQARATCGRSPRSRPPAVVPTTTIATSASRASSTARVELRVGVAERRVEVELERDAHAAVGGGQLAAQDDVERLALGQRHRHAVLRRREQRLARVGVRAQPQHLVEDLRPAQRELVATRPGAADDVLAGALGPQRRVDLDRAHRRIERAEPGELADLAVLGAEDGAVGGEEAHVGALDVGDRQPRVGAHAGRVA